MSVGNTLKKVADLRVLSHGYLETEAGMLRRPTGASVKLGVQTPSTCGCTLYAAPRRTHTHARQSFFFGMFSNPFSNSSRRQHLPAQVKAVPAASAAASIIFLNFPLHAYELTPFLYELV